MVRGKKILHNDKIMSDDYQILCSLLEVRDEDCPSYLLQKVNACNKLCNENYVEEECLHTMAFPDNAKRVPITCSQLLSQDLSKVEMECDVLADIDCGERPEMTEKESETINKMTSLLGLDEKQQMKKMSQMRSEGMDVMALQKFMVRMENWDNCYTGVQTCRKIKQTVATEKMAMDRFIEMEKDLE